MDFRGFEMLGEAMAREVGDKYLADRLIAEARAAGCRVRVMSGSGP